MFQDMQLSQLEIPDFFFFFAFVCDLHRHVTLSKHKSETESPAVICNVHRKLTFESLLRKINSLSLNPRLSVTKKRLKVWP